jgi:3'(2'), 5'-bisphosphate nucleotidase
MSPSDSAALLPALSVLARRAGAAILDIYASDFEVTTKSDHSPVTLADLKSERIILDGLRDLTPDIPVVSEEAAGRGEMSDLSGGRYWLVDPLDGTREFVKKNGEFTVNIGLIEAGVPVVGVLFAPAKNRLFAGAPGLAVGEDDDGPSRPIRCRPWPKDGLIVLGSRSFRDAEAFEPFLSRFPVAEIRRSGSALKYGLVAAGEADLYPRFGRTMEWDTAAGHAILNAAGGCVTLADGAPLTYGKAGFENPAVVAWGKPIASVADGQHQG